MRTVLIAISATLIINLSCGETARDASQVHLAAYSDKELQITFQYPDFYMVSSESHNALFRDGYFSVPMILRYVDEAEGRERGLWFGHEPAEDIALGGHPGKKYVYEHGDEPFSEATTAYVVAHQGKFLALEFRGNDTLTASVVLGSFVFTHL